MRWVPLIAAFVVPFVLGWQPKPVSVVRLPTEPIAKADTDATTGAYIVGDSRTAVVSALQNTPRGIDYSSFVHQQLPACMGVEYGTGGARCPLRSTLVNTEKLNCVTLVEHILALWAAHRRVYATGQNATDSLLFRFYVDALNVIRFYDGVNSCNEARYHYFTDAMVHLVQKGWVKDVAKDHGGTRLTKRIHYMSSHRTYYHDLRNWPQMLRVENQLTNAPRYYYPLDTTMVLPAAFQKAAQDGDIVALNTKVAGLDVSHVGFVTLEHDSLYYTHASSVAKEVTKENFQTYLKRRTSIDGLSVYRPTSIFPAARR